MSIHNDNNNTRAEGAPISHTSASQVSPRSIAVIAAEIRRDWKKPYFGAVPYLQAMSSLDTLHDSYGADDATSIVLYFLSNAGPWKGEVARRVKAELNAMVKQHKQSKLLPLYKR